MNKEWHKIMNSIKYQQLRNNDFNYLKQMFQTYATMKLNSCSASIVDLYNKCFQLNEKGFLQYIETRLPKKHFVAVINQL
jgi:hypothetical protein